MPIMTQVTTKIHINLLDHFICSFLSIITRDDGPNKSNSVSRKVFNLLFKYLACRNKDVK